MTRAIIYCLVALLASPCAAQTVRITSAAGEGLGVVVRITERHPTVRGNLGWVLTAEHVVAEDGRYTVLYEGGRSCPDARVIRRDEPNDIAIVWAWIPDGVAASVLADAPTQPGRQFSLHGRDNRRAGGLVGPATCDEAVYADLVLYPGDSGGPVFDEDRLVGIISAGWIWIDGDMSRGAWPMYASGLKPIRKLMERDE